MESLDLKTRWILLLALASLAGNLSSAQTELTDPRRRESPVILHGADLPSFLGEEEAQLALFRWSGSAWKRVPLQVDPVYDVDLCEATANPLDPGGSWPEIPPGSDPAVSCMEKRIDFSGQAEGNSTLDADDLLLFLAGEAGAVRTEGSGHPPGSTDRYYQIELSDPLTSPPERVYLYLYPGTTAAAPAGYSLSAETSQGRLASDNLPPDCTGADNQYTRFESEHFCAYWATRWSLDDLLTKLPGTSGCANLGEGTSENPRDLLDRWKGHEGDIGGAVDDDYWGCRSAFVNSAEPRPGEKIGPVRYVRGILGAKSGVISTLYSYVYPRVIQVETRLRAHNMIGIGRVFDLGASLKGSATIHLESSAPDSVFEDPVDGQLSTGCEIESGRYNGACVHKRDLRHEGAWRWQIVAPQDAGASALFVHTRLASDPVAFTKDPARHTSYKGFGSFYSDFHDGGTDRLNTALGEDEDEGSLGNAGVLFDLRTPFASCRAICPETDEQICRLGPDDPTDESCSFGTYYQPFVALHTLRPLIGSDLGADPRATGRHLRNLESNPLTVTSVFLGSGSSGESADIDGSGRVDGFDLAVIGRHFGSACGEPNYDPAPDLNSDCIVDGLDLDLLAGAFGSSR